MKAINRLEDIRRNRIKMYHHKRFKQKKESIAAMRAQNDAMREKGEGPKEGRPPGIQGAKTRSDKGMPRGPLNKK